MGYSSVSVAQTLFIQSIFLKYFFRTYKAVNKTDNPDIMVVHFLVGHQKQITWKLETKYQLVINAMKKMNEDELMVR